MPTLTAGNSVTLQIAGHETWTLASTNNTNFRAAFTPTNPTHSAAGLSRSFGPLITTADVGPFGVPGSLVLTVDAFPAGGALTYTYSSATGISPAVAAAVNGRYLYSRSGASMASPLATLTGVASGLFSVAGFPYVFPAGSLTTVGDVLHVMAMVRKRGANATATVNVYLGANNSTADGTIASLLATNVDSQDVFLVGSMFVGGSTNGVANIAAAWNSQGQSRFQNVVLVPGSPMYLNIGVTGANAADAFDLIAARAWVEKAAT